MNRNQIGTAWSGKHVVFIRCCPNTNEVRSFFQSLHAPIEPLHPLCTESLSIFLSIGYSISFVHTLPDGTVEYILTK